eukprot:311007-Pleurochrysis_carterae.AAC.2
MLCRGASACCWSTTPSVLSHKLWMQSGIQGIWKWSAKSCSTQWRVRRRETKLLDAASNNMAAAPLNLD